MSGRTVVSVGCADAAPQSNAATPAASASVSLLFDAPIACVLRSRSSRSAGDRTETKARERAYGGRSGLGKRRKPAVGPLAAHALVRERHLARPSHRLWCHRCEQPLRMVPPTTGWVTVLAGLLARGSLPGRPAFPVSQWLTRTTGSPLTVAGAATDEAANGSLARVPSCLPGATRGTSTGVSIPWAASRVKMTGDDVPQDVARKPHLRRLTPATRNPSMITTTNAGRFA
jgi:hypothetical protein